MKGWILHKHSEDEIAPEYYELNRFQEEAAAGGIDLRILKEDQFDLIVSRDDRRSVLVDGEALPLPDFLLPRRGASSTYFTLAVIRHLERLGVYSVNAADAIETVRDKLYTQQILAASGLPVLKTMLAKNPVDVELVRRHFGFPVVVKTIAGSQGSGVYLSKDRGGFEDLMQLLSTSRSSSPIILQEYLRASKGRDLRVIVVGGRAIACMERRGRKGKFKANYSSGGSVRPFAMNAEIEWLAVEAARLCRLDVAGIDLLFDGGHFRICEANSSPGFKGMEKSGEANIAREIFAYVRVRLGLFDPGVPYGDNSPPLETPDGTPVMAAALPLPNGHA